MSSASSSVLVLPLRHLRHALHDHFSVGQPADPDWFDLNVLMDTPLYVDPFLVFDENGEENVWTGAHEEIVDFFAAALDLVKKGPSSIAYPRSACGPYPGGCSTCQASPVAEG
jgi:hypothetical protein